MALTPNLEPISPPAAQNGVQIGSQVVPWISTNVTNQRHPLVGIVDCSNKSPQEPICDPIGDHLGTNCVTEAPFVRPLGLLLEPSCSNLEPVALTFHPAGSILGPMASFSGDSDQSACFRDPIRSIVSDCNSSSASDTHAHTHSHIPVGLVALASCLSSLGQNDQTEASLDCETDTDIAPGSWPSFAFQARCG